VAAAASCGAVKVAVFIVFPHGDCNGTTVEERQAQGFQTSLSLPPDVLDCSSRRAGYCG
jgi:hypothetical protein